ncbi:hypothetical protein ABHF33_07245 [Chitinibacter sp. FCG-7]|uniref:Uncharacterized protein n=1 Tax=Chitinibacter mangrovi TaxID=3153927 RepID=A0AAU7FEU9_9NEIS
MHLKLKQTLTELEAEYLAESCEWRSLEIRNAKEDGDSAQARICHSGFDVTKKK